MRDYKGEWKDPEAGRPAFTTITSACGRRMGNWRGRRRCGSITPSERLSRKPLSPCTRGRGVGVRGCVFADLPPHPQPLSPEYRGEGSGVQTLSIVYLGEVTAGGGSTRFGCRRAARSLVEWRGELSPKPTRPPACLRCIAKGETCADRTRFAVVLIVLLELCSLASRREAARSIRRDVQPIFKGRCYSCHDGRKHKAGLRLDVRASALRGGESGKPAIVPGDSKKSDLLRRVTSQR